MIERYENQVSCVNPSRKIEVYRNLHKKCWSVRQKGIVRFHCNQINLKDCEFVVQPAGHARVLKEKKKNVHAFVRGYITEDDFRNYDLFSWEDIYYNPYKANTFVDYENNPVRSAAFVDLSINDKNTPVLALNVT